MVKWRMADEGFLFPGLKPGQVIAPPSYSKLLFVQHVLVYRISIINGMYHLPRPSGRGLYINHKLAISNINSLSIYQKFNSNII